MSETFLLKHSTASLSLIDNIPLHLYAANFYYSQPCPDLKAESNNIKVIVTGYVLPRFHSSERSKFTKEKLVLSLFDQYKLEFIALIKGIFTIILIIDNEIHIFNDHLGISKIFRYQSGNEFIITNDLKLLSSIKKLEMDNKSLMIYSLTNNFINNRTAFKDVTYTGPATHLTIKNDKISSEKYWEPASLLTIPKSESTAFDIAEYISNISDSYVKTLNPDKVSMTLTGGSDSRVIFGSLLKNVIDVKSITYGSENSADVKAAASISDKTGIEHNQFPIAGTSEWFRDLAGKIVLAGNSLVSIHRAHRYNAYQNYFEKLSKHAMIFGGYMGGELIKNFFYDGIGVTNFSRTWINIKDREVKKTALKSGLAENFISISESEIDDFYDEINDYEIYQYDPRENELNYTFEVLIQLYHAQDINLLLSLVDFPVPLFLDMDLIEILFSSGHNFYDSYNKKSIVHKIRNAELYCKMINFLSPALAEIPLMKKGYYTPKEMIEDNKLAFLFKRGFRYIKRERYENSFNLTPWINDYLAEAFPDSINSFSSLYNQEKTKNIEFSKLSGSEGYYRKYTNPVYFRIIKEKFIL